jgi:hypothetical protein
MNPRECKENYAQKHDLLLYKSVNTIVMFRTTVVNRMSTFIPMIKPLCVCKYNKLLNKLL